MTIYTIACLFKRNPEHPKAETLIINLWLLIAVDCILISLFTLKVGQTEGKRNTASTNLHTCHVLVQWSMHSLRCDNTFHTNIYQLGNSFVAHWQVCSWSWQNQGHSETGLDETFVLILRNPSQSLDKDLPHVPWLAQTTISEWHNIHLPLFCVMLLSLRKNYFLCLVLKKVWVFCSKMLIMINCSILFRVVKKNITGVVSETFWLNQIPLRQCEPGGCFCSLCFRCTGIDWLLGGNGICESCDRSRRAAAGALLRNW